MMSLYSIYIGLFLLISISVKNKTPIKSFYKLDNYRKLVLYLIILCLVVGLFSLSINWRGILSFLHLFLFVGVLNFLFWTLYQKNKFDLNLPKFLDFLLILTLIYSLLIDIWRILIHLKFLPPLLKDYDLIVIVNFIIHYVAFIFGVNSIAKSKNRDNVGWTILSILLIHSFITLIIISFLSKIEKRKFSN